MMRRMQEANKWREAIEKYEGEKIECKIIEGQGLVLNSKKGSFLFKNGFFGKPVGVKKPEPGFYEKNFSFSIFEVLYLYDKEIFIAKQNDKNLNQKELLQIGRDLYSDFPSKYTVYEDLREKGWIVRPGLKYGADFSIYQYGPHLEHAPLLINIFSKDKELLGIDFVRSGRLATSVKKKWALALVLNDSVEYLTFKWYRP